jgi:hypothetical protein
LRGFFLSTLAANESRPPMSLAHRDQELALPASVHLAKAGAAVADRIALNVFVPEDRQRYVLALEKLAPSGGVA